MNYSDYKKIVLKIGSSLIAPTGNGCSVKYTLPIARFIQQCQSNGKQLVLVSSGSIAAGRNQIDIRSEHPTVAQKQAMAAVGQYSMMENWKRFFDKPCAQLLVTHAELNDQKCRTNIKNTIDELLSNQILPIVNENDTVATEELKVGDNDRLAAMIAILTEADLFMIGSDVNGLYTRDPNIDNSAEHIPHVSEITKDIIALAGGTNNQLATGGMRTKLEAATNAMQNKIPTILFKASDANNFQSFLDGIDIGTSFYSSQNPSN
ncbi:MAG: glutamate 5-kinase [Kangiellaceae bacterium]|nr:glutamate 5-kinase [Kangiellaceae bacterium]